MDLTFAGNTLVRVSPQHPILTRCVGTYCLDFALRLRFVADGGRLFSLHSLSVRVSVMVPNQNIFLGTALPLSPMRLDSSEHPLEPTYSVQLALSLAQLNELESIRNGRDIAFSIQVAGFITRDDVTSSVSASEQLVVPQSTWIEQLGKCGYRKILLLEIPILESTALHDFPVVARELADAQDHLLHGQFTAVIASCRKAQEALENVLPDKSILQAALEAYRKDRTSREGMTQEQRLLVIRAALTHYLHLSHHADPVAASAKYSRRDAIWALTLTAATIRHALEVDTSPPAENG